MTAAERRHVSSVCAIGCIVCLLHYGQSAEAEPHHIRTGQGKKRASHYEVIPLCSIHHNRPFTLGTAFHAGQETWQEKYGDETFFLAVVTGYLERG